MSRPAATSRPIAASGGCGPDRFTGLSWRSSPHGAVFLDGARAWLECSIEQEIRAGDHDIVLLRVHDLEADHDIAPLVFHGSQFRRLHPPPTAQSSAA